MFLRIHKYKLHRKHWYWPGEMAQQVKTVAIKPKNLPEFNPGTHIGEN